MGGMSGMGGSGAAAISWCLLICCCRLFLVSRACFSTSDGVIGCGNVAVRVLRCIKTSAGDRPVVVLGVVR